ncbi:MAG: 4-hydroxyphenylacetate 3-hydroxylase N-terminal domain-containing protein [Pseudomonadales bacterium]|jgi:4-hydroxybutyryl-CoA dehydratase/vinylacetyl-CoA-Delta-isomerase|nr:4-hydroxyphenylacetate 3-hydroxylase N-terminal domain-containing protein [Pseudomonadales bacterium]MDP6472293.1 4-hydroxyphenylacetate 3-hydroxylase N-terminal domain-containing protein [Pseudomonadales bacterium]
MMTGDEYRASLNDGRETFFEGEQIEDLPAHRILGITVDSAASGYDRFYDPEPGAIGAFMVVPGSAAELREQVDLHESVDLLTHVTYASIMTLLTAADRIEGSAPENAKRIRAWVGEAQRRDVRITQCITDAKGDRSRRPGQQEDPDAYVHVVERRDDGIVIRGAKLHISAASMGHELMTIPTKSMKAGEEEYSVAAMVPVNAPGVKIVNTTYAPRHEDVRDFPMSGSHHTPEGFVIFDDVFVPDERVFLGGEHPELAGIFAHSLGLWERLGGLAGMVTAYDRLVGFAQLISEANGLEKMGHIKEKISEMMINATLIRASLEAAIENCSITSDGAAFPHELYINVGKYHGAANYSMMVRHLHDIAGGSILTAPGMADLENDRVGHLIRKYMGTKQEVDGTYRTRLFHAIRDYTADALGGWHAVTNIQAGGGLYAQRIVSRMHYDIDHAKRVALESAHMGEYID